MSSKVRNLELNQSQKAGGEPDPLRVEIVQWWEGIGLRIGVKKWRKSLQQNPCTRKITHYQGESFCTKWSGHLVLSPVWLFATSWTVSRQSPQSMGFTRQEYWSGSTLPSPGDLPDPGIEPGASALAGGFFATWSTLSNSVNKKCCQVLHAIPM